MRYAIRLFVIVNALLWSGGVSAFEWKQGETLWLTNDTSDAAPVVKSALRMLAEDMRECLSSEMVSGQHVESNVSLTLIEDSKICGGHREAFRIKTCKNGITIEGSDAHGLAYGVLELSRMMGVSPWTWWADVEPRSIESLSLKEGVIAEQWPEVDYRGIFINDEDWGLMPWASENYEPGMKGRVGPRTTERIFQLLLRLRANAYWPPMHECTRPFFLTEGNRAVAEKYGIYVGGSHCEPMASSTAGEWPLRGNGAFDYVNNADEVRKFWKERVQDVATQPIIYTIGMRGVHDGAMQGASTVDEQRKVLETVFADQRDILSNCLNKEIESIPQVFIPYKEVQEVYDSGLNVPDDVCLMWCDDNYGYIRHFPTKEEQMRKGGNGMYYHASYWGRPHDYLWLGTFAPSLLYHEMNRAFDYGIRRMWILNVGDIKPLEYQTELFLDMAWQAKNLRKDGVREHLRHFLCREFGHDVGECLLPIMMEHYRLAFIHRPEFMGGTRTEEKERARWNTLCDLPWDENYLCERLRKYSWLEKTVDSIGCGISSDRRDAYFQLVEYPVKAASEMNRKFITAQMARHGLMSWEESDAAYDSIQSLTNKYNALVKGKWDGMMDAAPRRLPVFGRVPHDTMTNDMPQMTQWKYQWNCSDRAKGKCIEYEDLGYDGHAFGLEKNRTVTFCFEANGQDSVEVKICMLPTHPVNGNGLRCSVSIDAGEETMFDYSTKGRSEEWKMNVLWNRAVRHFRLPLQKGKKEHQLKLKALDTGVIVDEICVR